MKLFDAHTPDDIGMGLAVADSAQAQKAARELQQRYEFVEAHEADVIVALGGDGLMLQVLREQLPHGKPVFGMNCGSVGFLLNAYAPDYLPKRLAAARAVRLNPLLMTATTMAGEVVKAHAVNDVNLWRHSRQAAKLEIKIDGVVRISELICDGVIVCSPAGSTAYNLSAHGPILPLQANALAITPVSPFRPRRWRGAILHHQATIAMTVREPDKRPVHAAADTHEVSHVAKVEVAEDPHTVFTLLFDPDHSLEERILREQFAT